MSLWYRFNGYNFTPGKAPAHGTMWTLPCGSCGGRIAPGFEAHSYGPVGAIDPATGKPKWGDRCAKCR